MDWSSFYPGFVASRDDQTALSTPASKALPTVKPLTQDVEVVDIGCGFGGLLVALAPLLPNKLILGLFKYNVLACRVSTNLTSEQVWKYEPKYPNLCRSAYEPCEPRMSTQLYTKISPVSGPTP